MPAKKEAKNRPALATTAQPTLSPASLGILAAFVAAALYLPTLQYGWVWDDRLLVASRGAGGVGAEGFRPLASLFYRLEWALGFGTPLFAHLASIALHALATWLFYRLALHVGARPGISFTASLLFAAHPVHVEAVAYVSGRPDLLATVFSLAALLLARSAELCSPEGCRSWKIYPAYAAMAATVLSEEVAIVTPLVLVGLDRWGRTLVPWRRRMTHYSGFFAIVLVYWLVRFTAGGGEALAPGSAHATSGIDAEARPWAVPMAFYEFLRMLVAPYPLNALRTLTAADVASWGSRIVPFLALAAFALLVRWRRRDPIARAGALVLALALLPALPFALLVGSFGEERAVYYASVGFCLLVASVYAWGVQRLPNLRPAPAMLAIAIAAAAGVGTLARLPVWRDNVALLRAAAVAAPDDAAPHLALVDHYTAEGNWLAALAEIDRALAIEPRNHAAVSKQVGILSRLGRYAESEASARRAIELDPRDAVSYSNLADALIQQGKPAEALEAGRRAIELDSTLVNGWYNYGVVLASQGDAPGAIRAYEKAISLQPDNVLALNNLGALLGSTGRLTEARDLYIRLVGLAPNSIEARMNLALAYLRLGDRVNAGRERDTVRRLNPSAVRRLDEIFKEYLPDFRRHAPPAR